jgi:integrase
MSSLDYRGKEKTSYIRYRINGRMFRKNIGKVSKTVAHQILRKFEDDLALSKTGIPTNKISQISDFFDLYLSHVKQEQAYNTFLSKQLSKDNFLKFLSVKKLSHIIYIHQIDPSIIEEYKLYRLTQVKARTVNIELNFISASLKTANEWNIKAPDIKIKRLREEKKLPRYFSNTETASMLQHASAYQKQIIIISIFTGLRISELLHLKWENIDFDRNIIQILNDADFKTKTRKDRVIPLHSAIKSYLLYLKDHFIDSKTDTISSRTSSQRKYVICNTLGNPVKSVRKAFSSLLKKLNITDASLHTLRHTFASICVMNNIDLYTIKEFLGHTQITTTEIYAHISQDFMKKNIEKLNYSHQSSDLLSFIPIDS